LFVFSSFFVTFYHNSATIKHCDPNIKHTKRAIYEKIRLLLQIEKEIKRKRTNRKKKENKQKK